MGLCVVCGCTRTTEGRAQASRYESSGVEPGAAQERSSDSRPVITEARADRPSQPRPAIENDGARATARADIDAGVRCRLLPRRRLRPRNRVLAPLVAETSRRLESSAGSRAGAGVYSSFLGGRFADAVPWLEATRAWAGNAELGYILGQAYVQNHRPIAPAMRLQQPTVCRPIRRPRISSRANDDPARVRAV